MRKQTPRDEVVLWGHLRDKKIDGIKFRRQYGIGKYIVDFYSPQIQLVIGIDGDSHFGIKSKKNDKSRQRYIESLGIRLIRFTNHDISGFGKSAWSCSKKY